MTEFELAQIALKLYDSRMNRKTWKNDYAFCLEKVKEAHGVESSEENCECPNACKLHWSVSLRKYKEGYDEGYKNGFEDGKKSVVKVVKSAPIEEKTLDDMKEAMEKEFQRGISASCLCGKGLPLTYCPIHNKRIF